LGLSALAGSLVAVSAQAGEMSVSGSANVTFKSGGAGHTGGQSIGTDKDVAFTGSGELDNGYTFKVVTLLTDGYVVSSSFTQMTMGSLGTITANGTNAGGSAMKYDEEVPQVYEQSSDAPGNSADKVGNNLDSSSLTYNSPSFDLGGASVSFDVDYAPQADDATINDGGRITYSETIGKGFGLGTTVNYDALTVGVYGAEVENKTPNAAGNDAVRDAFEGVWYAKYSMGPVSVGYSESYSDSGKVVAVEAATAAKVVRTAGGIFESESMSIAFNVNDDFSISWTDTDDTYDAQSSAAGAGGTETIDVTQSTTAIQMAYSMGAMSIKAYNMDTENPGYDSNALDSSVTEIAIGLAF
jgi:outer membrane protein OmpU